MSLAAVVTSALILGGIGLTFGTLIALANRRLFVWEDPRIDGVSELLPGTNCGACGFAGCRAFAEGLIAGRTQPAECTVIGPDDVADVAHYLGVEAGEVTKRVARLLCAGGCDVAVQQADYRGLQTCAAAAAVASGTADVGLGILAGARALGLDFVPLLKERYDLVIPRAYYESSPIQMLLEMIRSQVFKDQVLSLGGYDTSETGRVIAEVSP